jgi:hypothetical protein
VASIIESINFDGLFNLMLATIRLTAPVSATLLSRSIREGGFCLFLAINREFFLFEHRWRVQSPYLVEDLCCLAKINREIIGKYKGLFR